MDAPTEATNDSSNQVTKIGSPISTVADLEYIRAYPGGDYYLTNDINLEEAGNLTNFIPIPVFYGTLDGQNYSISGFKIAPGYYRSLFGYITGGKIKNLKISNALIESTPFMGSSAVLADQLISGVLENIQIEANVTIRGDGNLVASLVGSSTTKNNSWNDLPSKIINCRSAAVIQVTRPGALGGLVAYSSKSEITNSRFTGSITSGSVVTTTPQHIGGLIGLSSHITKISNSSATGNINHTGVPGAAMLNVGGLVGTGATTSIQNSSSNMTIQISNMPTLNVGGIGGTLNMTSMLGTGDSLGNYFPGSTISTFNGFSQIKSSGSITLTNSATATSTVGGFFGQMNSALSDSPAVPTPSLVLAVSDIYSNTNISVDNAANTKVGGLIGSAESVSLNRAISMSTISAISPLAVGGLIAVDFKPGFGPDSTITEGYWSTDLNPSLSTSSPAFGGSAKMDSQLRMSSLYTGWPATKWAIVNGQIPQLILP